LKHSGSLLSHILLILRSHPRGPRPGQLRDSGLWRRNRSSPQHHGRAALQLHRRRPAQNHRRRAPTNHAEHETIEITQGINDWSEVGFYIFTSEQSGLGRAVGRRPHPPPCPRAGKVALAGRRQPLHRSRLPARSLLARHLDLGDSPHRRQTTGRWYFAVNPALERTWHGPT
jgi:hypothetical protein